MSRIVIVFVVLLVVGMFSCNGEDEKVVTDSAACKTSSVNPNGDSELAILMRELAAFTDSVKQDLLNKRTPRQQPTNLSTILTAKKTDEHIDKSIYDPFARSYIANVEFFYASKPEDQIENYNSMVNLCVSCHENFCGGPIKRIQKLFIPTK